ncbi:hypothetical protein F5888DRAFT_580533 [Russula emetica]|nr:hypothetical protein F5888DRAFT_580533 [Russula emetica]
MTQLSTRRLLIFFPIPMIPANASVQPASSSAPAPSPPSDLSRPQSRLRPLTVQFNYNAPRDSSILTPPPTAHPKSLSSSSFSRNQSCAAATTTATHTPPPLPNHVPGVVAYGVNASIQPPTRLQNPLHVSSNNYPQQQQQVSIQENGVVHAQLAPHPLAWVQHPPQVVTEPATATPKLRPVTLPLEQQQYQQQQQQQRMMTHSTTTATTAIKPASASAQMRSNQSQLYPIPAQVSTRGQQPVQPAIASPVPGAPGTQTRPQSVMQPHTQTSERTQKRPPPVSVPSSSPSTQSQVQQRQQQQQQDASMPPPTIAAFRVLQPAKALLEKTWATAMDAVGREFAELNAEHIRSVREQQRLTELLQRCETERVQALRSLHDTKAQLRECHATAQVDRRARLHYERAFLEMSSQVRRLLSMPVLVESDVFVLSCAALEKCTCGAISVKKLWKTPQPLLAPPPSLPSSSTSVPPSPAAAAAAPTPSIVNGKDRAAAPTTSVETTTNKPCELRRGREEETVGGEGESAPKRRKITPSSPRSTPVSAPSLTPPTPVSDVVTTPEVAEVVQVAAKDAEETVVVVPTDKDCASAAICAPNHYPHQSAPGSESDSTLPEPDPKPKPTQEQGPDSSAVAATGNDDVVSAPRKIGIQHIQLVYETVGETLQCRMCLLRKRELDEDTPVAMYSVSASYSELVGHCEEEHEAALDALACMTPSDIAEMQQRMQSAR